MIDSTPELEEVQPRDPKSDPLANVNYFGQWYRQEDMPAVRRQEAVRRAAYRKRMKEEWSLTERGKMCLELYAKFQEYKNYLQDHPHARFSPDGSKLEFEEHGVFQEALCLVSDYERERNEKLRRNLERARLAARCQHVHTDGERCGSPRMRRQKLCYHHLRIAEAKAVKLDLGPMEDADSIQLAIMKLQGAIVDGALESKQVSQLSYLIQLAAWNVTRTTTALRYEVDEVEEEGEEGEEDYQ